MTIIKWAAVTVTALMGLMNVGLVLGDSSAALKATGVVLAVLAVAAVVGFASGTSWGRNAVVAVGALNVIGGIIGAVNDVEGWPVGLVVAALGLVLGVLYRPGGQRLGSSPASA